MAVYERAYRGYTGPTTPERRRFLIPPRYAFAEVFRSRLFAAFFAGCFLWPCCCAFLIYLHHNMSALALLEIPRANLLAIDAGFFLWFLRIQGTMLGFLIAFVVGPSLISPDMRNNALPLYLSRPFSRTEYVVGKISVLVVLLSAITWVPGTILFFLQSYLDGADWLGSHVRILAGLLLGSWIWIALLSLLALAVSASVRWKPLASAALFGIFFVASAAGAAVNATFRTTLGGLLDLSAMVQAVWAKLFGVPPPLDLPVAGCVVSLLLVCLLCVALLARRIRAYEVVR